MMCWLQNSKFVYAIRTSSSPGLFLEMSSDLETAKSPSSPYDPAGQSKRRVREAKTGSAGQRKLWILRIMSHMVAVQDQLPGLIIS